MNPDVKAKWVARLRDPSVKQGRGALRTDRDEFCCLGVLCELAVEAGVITAPALVKHECSNPDCPERGSSKYAYGGTGEISYLPESVQRWSGLDQRAPGVLSPDESGPYHSLAYMNDHGRSFTEIADIIEHRL